MTPDEFVSEIEREVHAAWADRAWWAWFMWSAALAGARLGRWLWK